MVERVKVVIVGSGFAGLCMGIKLQQAGYRDFVILEKADGLGGTWRENTYPGAECDVPSALYSYSFEHNPEWEYKWSGQKQILKYQHDTAAKHGLDKFIRFKQEVCSAVFNDDTQRWLVTTQSGHQFDTQHFVTAVGQLHKTFTPKIKAVEQFCGEVFHSAQWNHSINLAGLNVGVIGNAASAVQLVPEVAKAAAQLTVFQRSPNWTLPKVDRPYHKWEQRLSMNFPWVARMYRWFIWATGEYGILPAINGNRLARWAVRKACLKNINDAIKDPVLRASLIPDYPVGAKRVLFSDHYFPTLANSHVSLDTHGIDSFTADGIKNKVGTEYQLDVVIYATGFETNPFLADIDVSGSAGLSIRDAWSKGAQAYLGMTSNGFPNMYLLYGPNTNLGHTSIIIMLEAQVNYIVEMIRSIDEKGMMACEVKHHAEEAYNNEIQSRLRRMAFSKVANSWYIDGGRVTNNWAGGTREYVRRLKDITWQDYLLR